MTNTNNNGGLGRSASELSWLLGSFAERTVGVSEAVAVSADGFLLAASVGRHREGVEQFAAIVSGLTSLTFGAAELFGLGSVNQLIVEMDQGYFFVMSVNGGSIVGVLAEADCDVGLIGYEMTLLIQRVGTVLTPALIDELKNSISGRAS